MSFSALLHVLKFVVVVRAVLNCRGASGIEEVRSLPRLFSHGILSQVQEEENGGRYPSEWILLDQQWTLKLSTPLQMFLFSGHAGVVLMVCGAAFVDPVGMLLRWILGCITLLSSCYKRRMAACFTERWLQGREVAVTSRKKLYVSIPLNICTVFNRS